MRVINQLEPEDWQVVLGPAYETLRALSGGRSICDWASHSFTDAYHPYDILSNKEKRDVIIGKIPEKGIKAIAEKLNHKPSGVNSYQLVRECKFRKNSQEEKLLIDYFGIERPKQNIRISRPPEMSLDTVEYGLYDYQRKVLQDV